MEHLEHAQAQWEAEFPAANPTLIALRDCLIAADCDRLQARAALHQLNTLLTSTRQPAHLWHPLLTHEFETLQRRAQRNDNHFMRALKHLQTAYAAHKTAKAKTAAAAPPAPHQLNPVYHEQVIYVRHVNGHAVAEIKPDAAFFLSKSAFFKSNIRFTRRYFFENNSVPDEYAYVLTDSGQTYAPARSFGLTYEVNEFLRLCRLEVETNSPRVIDGERVEYQRVVD